jgi:hypothetical protein
MPKKRESKMLELVRQWRAEAYEEFRRETPALRRQRTREWAKRLNLPMFDDESQPGDAAKADSGAAR